MYQRAQNYEFPEDIMEELLDYMYVQLIIEYLSSRSNPEHLSPVINRMSGLKKDIRKIFNTASGGTIWAETNFVVLNLNMVNLTMATAVHLHRFSTRYAPENPNGPIQQKKWIRYRPLSISS